MQHTWAGEDGAVPVLGDVLADGAALRKEHVLLHTVVCITAAVQHSIHAVARTLVVRAHTVSFTAIVTLRCCTVSNPFIMCPWCHACTALALNIEAAGHNCWVLEVYVLGI